MKNIHNIKKKSFGLVSQEYDRVRPDYPQKAIEDILKMSKIKKDGKIIDLGCGSGIATLPFAKKGYEITALDLSRPLLEIAKKKMARFKKVKFILSSFEKEKFQKESYDLVISAQAFHWLDQKTRLKRIHQMLKKDGHLCLIANVRRQDKSAFYKKLRSLYNEAYPNFTKSVVHPDNFLLEIGSHLFKNLRMKKYFRTLQYSKKDFAGLQATFSWVSTLPKKESLKFFSALDDIMKDKKRIAYPVETIILIAQKK